MKTGIKELTAQQITKEVLMRFKARGYEVWKQPNWTRGKRKNQVKRGCPDVIGFWKTNAVFVAVEVKTIKDTFSKDQIKFLKELQVSGGHAFIATQQGSEVLIEQFDETKHKSNDR